MPSKPSTLVPVIDTFIAPPCDEQIEILYQDGCILVINKPSGLLSLSGKNPLNNDSVHYRLAQLFPDVRLLHRLDLGTSGIILLALNKQINAILTKQFQAQTVAKTYQALLLGELDSSVGTINAPIAKDAALFPRLKICFETGKPAITEYQVLDYDSEKQLTRICFKPITGRTHQLRLHSQYIGHAILGCDLYGGLLPGDLFAGLLYDKGIQSQPQNTLSPSRLMLHAQSLSFDHPTTGDRMTIDCPCPF
jgi:tRNA pseudouridine32 synthase/23S rRNA pseudouridine746 synthase